MSTMHMRQRAATQRPQPRRLNPLLRIAMGVAWRVRVKVGMLRFKQLHGVNIGRHTTINPAATFMDYGMVEIGEWSSISGVLFITHSGGDRIFDLPSTAAPIRVGNHTMIGAGVMICPGVTIGDWCVIGAGCVIRKDVPSGTVMVPAEPVAACSTWSYIAAKSRNTQGTP